MKNLTAQSTVLHSCFCPIVYSVRRTHSTVSGNCQQPIIAPIFNILVSWLLVCSSAYWKPFFGSALRLLFPVCTVARLIYPPVRDSQWSSITFQTYKILLVYARPTPPDRLVLLLSSMSQFLSVCVPSDFHGRERPQSVHTRSIFILPTSQNRHSSGTAFNPPNKYMGNCRTPNYPQKLRIWWDEKDLNL